MSRYSLRPRAEQDLIEHFAFIAKDKVAPADRFLEVAAESFDRLSEMPGIGRRWESKDKRLRGIRVLPMPAPYRSYLIFYRVGPDQQIEVLAILHAARDVGALIKDIF